MFKQILNVKHFIYKDSFNGDQDSVIVKVETKEGIDKEYIIARYGGYIHEWPLGRLLSGPEVEELRNLLRSYDIHKAACDLGAV